MQWHRKVDKAYRLSLRCLPMKSYQSIPLTRLLAILGLVGFFGLLALTCAVHFHSPTVDQTQSECPVCLIGAPSKMFVVPPAASPLYLAMGVAVMVATPTSSSLPLWDNAPSRSPPSLA
jgi:hypothetical protein